MINRLAEMIINENNAKFDSQKEQKELEDVLTQGYKDIFKPLAEELGIVNSDDFSKFICSKALEFKIYELRHLETKIDPSRSKVHSHLLNDLHDSNMRVV